MALPDFGDSVFTGGGESERVALGDRVHHTSARTCLLVDFLHTTVTVAPFSPLRKNNFGRTIVRFG
jgi:hypothetical protein